MKDNKKGTRFLVRLETRQYEMAAIRCLADMTDEEADNWEDAPSSDDDVQKMQLTTEAWMLVENGRLSVSYDETELSGLEGAETTVSFDVGEPGLITVTREGSAKMSLVIEAGRRHVCVYETPLMPFELTTYGRKVENSLTEDGGRLTLDYIIEIKGALAEHTVLTLQAKRLIS